MSRGKVYISGPITGTDFGNRFAFSCARNALELCGYEVVDPSEVQLDDEATWTDYMRADLKLLLDCDFIYMLEGWEKSRGARIELALAKISGSRKSTSTKRVSGSRSARLRKSTSMPITTCRSRWASPTSQSA